MIDLLEFNNKFNGINIIICKNNIEKSNFIKSIYTNYLNFFKIYYQMKLINNNNNNNKKDIIINHSKKLKYKNSLIFMDMSVFLKNKNGLSIKKINTFKTPIFIFSINIVSQKNILSLLDNYCKKSDRIIFSGSILNRTKITIEDYTIKDLAFFTNNFKNWLIYNYNHNTLYKYYVDNYFYISLKQNNKLLNKNNLEYILDNPILYKTQEDFIIFI